METLASSCLPMPSAQVLSPSTPGGDIETLSGAEFLQTLAALNAGAAPGPAEAPLLQGLATAFEEQAEELEEPVDAAYALQWLPLAQFIESGIAQKSSSSIAAPTGKGAPGSVTSAFIPGMPAAAASASATAVLPEQLLAGSGEDASRDAAFLAETLAEAELANSAAGFTDKPPGGLLTGSQALAASVSAANALHAGASRSQGAVPMSAEQTLQAHIQAPVHSARWAQEIGQRITLMAAAGQQNGTLSLTPEHLGPLEVRINVSQDTANVWFGAQQADTRAALTDALPRLREMFAANGLSLGEANVSHEAPRQDSEAAKAFRGETGSLDDAGSRDLPRHVQRVSLGMIDTYA